MALSPAMQWALNNGMTEADVYKNINDFLATSPDAATTQAQMAQYGISGEDVAAATNGKSGGMLGGNILAGASWNSLNTSLPEQLTQATGQATTNTAVGGATTADTLNQLNTFLSGGGQFDPNATVYLQTGGVDFLQGVDKGTIKDNISQMVKTLGSQGVNVVLTGSPYATSINDVVTNNFDPKVDPLFTEIAKENKNVALVGTQGEILQNKALLVDALHTNAEGTAIYNQSVIDALSQFKNTVPSSTPTAIAQAQQTNTVATAPAVITQAAASPAVAQTLAKVIPTARGTVIEGDNIDAQMAGVPQVVYETKVDPNNSANWQTINPKTGEVINSGTFAGGGDKGLLAAAAPVIGLAASTVGLPGITGLLGGLTGTTGSTLAGLTGATIAGGTNAIAGGNTQDILKAALLGGAGAFGGSVLNNYLDTGSFADPSITEKQFAIQDAKQLAAQGLSTAQIQDTLTAGGYNDITVERALASVTSPTTTTAATSPTTSIPAVTDTVNVTGTAAPTINTGGLLSSLVTTPAASTAVSTPVTNGGTVKVTGTSTPQQVDAATLALVNSQLASNVKTPTNLANVQVTGNKGIMSGDTTATDMINTLAGLSTTTPTAATTLPTQTITAKTPVTTQEVATIVSSLIPTATPAQSAAIAEQVITGSNPKTTQEAVNAVVSTLTPTAVTTPVNTPAAVEPNVTITADKPTNVGDTLALLPSTLLPASVTTPTTTPTKTNELGLTDAQMLSLLQGGLGLLGGLGGASLIGGGGGTSTGIGTLPTQTPPMYTDDYFTKVQQNYNRLLPAVPRDVASPLRDWYTSQYGA